MFRPHMGHHQATLIIWGDRCTVHFVFITIRHIVVVVVVVVVVNLLRRIFSSYVFLAAFSVFHFSMSFTLDVCV
jgi:hypothetical protein